MYCKICCGVRQAASRVRLVGLISPTALKHPCRSRKIKIQIGGVGGGDGVAGLVAAQAEAVHNDESSRCFTHSLPLFSAQKRGLIPDWQR